MAAARACPLCFSKAIDIDDSRGQASCTNCGTILEDHHFVSSVEFQESGGGHSVMGQFVSSSATKSFGNIGTSGRNYGAESRQDTLQKSKSKMHAIAGMMNLTAQYIIDSAHRIYAMAFHRNFTHGRRTNAVLSASLYIICRRDKLPHLLIDFADKLQLNVYVLGGVFLKLCKLLKINNLPLIDPSLYIHRFASQLRLGSSTQAVATMALRLVATMKRDWIETGRRPSGICGAALLIAARSHDVDVSLGDVMDVVSIGERTLRLRLLEFSMTPTAQLTMEQVGKLELSRIECDPPSFQRHREHEVMQVLLHDAESTLAIEDGRKHSSQRRLRSENSLTTRAITNGHSANHAIDDSETDDASNASALVLSKWDRVQDESVSRFLSGDPYYRNNATALLHSLRRARDDPRDGQDSVHDDDDMDFGFDDANDQLVNRASRQAAQQVLMRLREKSSRVFKRKRKETAFFEAIERDLQQSLEFTSEGLNLLPAIANENGFRKEALGFVSNNSDGYNRSITSRSEHENKQHDNDNDEQAAMETEQAETLGDEPDSKEEDRDVGEEGKQNTDDLDDATEELEDRLSDIDDDEINSLLLSPEEAGKKKLLWEKLNADYIHQQEQKRLNALNHPEVTKKKRKKKQVDVNAPPPDTAQHAIHKLKSRRINYEVIGELFGEIIDT